MTATASAFGMCAPSFTKAFSSCHSAMNAVVIMGIAVAMPIFVISAALIFSLRLLIMKKKRITS